MSKLQLSVAIGDYDRMRPLVDGLVQIDRVDAPEELFHPSALELHKIQVLNRMCSGRWVRSARRSMDCLNDWLGLAV
jgi:hypothetical protein